jgi:hypothetical protein
MLPFVEALRVRPSSSPFGLRVKRFQGMQDLWEITFAGDGRATVAHGAEVRPGDVHVIWRRVGTHDVLSDP